MRREHNRVAIQILQREGVILRMLTKDIPMKIMVRKTFADLNLSDIRTNRTTTVGIDGERDVSGRVNADALD